MKEFEKDVELANFSTFGIGGRARFYTFVTSVEELQEVLAYCTQENYPFHILGKGSNTLFSDQGFDGVVIHNKIQFCEIEGTCVFVGAGFSFSFLGIKTAKCKLGGLEFASGIPASVGGAIFMNAGANGVETADALTEILFINAKGEKETFLKKELHFSYRYSSFHEMQGAIAAARFQLTPFAQARKKQTAILAHRIKTQPYKALSCGCVFRNPKNAKAGALIEKCGLKGMQIGGAKVSELHANFIINEKKASAKEVLALANYVYKEVKKQTGYDLEIELRIQND